MGYVGTSNRAKRVSSHFARAYRATSKLAPLLGVLGLPFATGCTAILDINKEQCSVNADCTDLFGPTAPYLCSDHICERPACNTNAECRANGESFATAICDGNHLCATAECVDNSKCGAGQTCDLTTNRCVKSECDTTEDCLVKSASPTVMCTAGFCVDPTWGCIGKADNRAHTPGETGTVKIKLLTSDMMKPLVNPTWQIKVCSPPQFDPNCASPLPLPAPTYEADTGTVTISGLEYDKPVRMMFDEVALKDPDGQSTYIPVDFFTQRPPVGVSELPPLRVTSRMGLANLVESFKAFSASQGIDQAVNPALANIYGLLFDCEEKPANQVSLKYTNPIGMDLDPKPSVLFFNEQNIPNLKRTYSFPTGVFSTLNIPLENINIATSVVVSLDGMGNATRTRDIRTDYTMRLAPYRQTIVHFYPRDYTK